MNSSYRTPPQTCNTLLANLKKAKKVDTVIGKLWSPSNQNSLSMVSDKRLETATPNSLDPLQPPRIARKKRQPLKELSLNMERNPFPEMLRSNGSLYGPPPSPEIYQEFPQMYVWSIIGPLEPLVQIIQEQQEWSVNAWCSGEKLELAKVDVHGMKLAWMLTAKIPARNSGTVIKMKKTLLSMNFEEESTYPICYDGWTDIRSEWKLKEHLNL